jgi:hypothetical protein
MRLLFIRFVPFNKQSLMRVPFPLLCHCLTSTLCIQKTCEMRNNVNKNNHNQFIALHKVLCVSRVKFFKQKKNALTHSHKKKQSISMNKQANRMQSREKMNQEYEDFDGKQSKAKRVLKERKRTPNVQCFDF